MWRGAIRFVTAGLVVTTVLGLVGLGFLGYTSLPAKRPIGDEIREPFFKHLTKARRARRGQVVAYFADARRRAEGIRTDQIMLTAFHQLHGGDEKLSAQDEMAVDVRFVTLYGEFYDILFVDESGYVFHSMRREADFRENFFSGALSSTKLARRLAEVDDIGFVDYELYPPSDEPAAFFVIAVYGSEGVETARRMGWFVLQAPLNKLNSILSDRRGLGRTGEVYLVNTDKRMMTDSRFRPSSAELALSVETEAVSAALELGAGNAVIRDYRETRVLSSFESFELLGARWVIVAEVDEDEVITEHYRRYRAEYRAEILRYLGRSPLELELPAVSSSRVRRVDMNEFRGTGPDVGLSTAGVATCTGVAAVLPGRFGYLAHIGPSDRIYGQPDLGHNDVLGDMMDRIERYDIVPAELSQLEFTIVATHELSFASALDTLLARGVELEQIRFALNPGARFADMRLEPGGGGVGIEWVSPEGARAGMAGHDVDTLGRIVRRLAFDVTGQSH